MMKKGAGAPFKKAALLRDKLIELQKQWPEGLGAPAGGSLRATTFGEPGAKHVTIDPPKPTAGYLYNPTLTMEAPA